MFVFSSSYNFWQLLKLEDYCLIQNLSVYILFSVLIETYESSLAYCVYSLALIDFNFSFFFFPLNVRFSDVFLMFVLLMVQCRARMKKQNKLLV